MDDVYFGTDIYLPIDSRYHSEDIELESPEWEDLMNDFSGYRLDTLTSTLNGSVGAFGFEEGFDSDPNALVEIAVPSGRSSINK